MSTVDCSTAELPRNAIYAPHIGIEPIWKTSIVYQKTEEKAKSKFPLITWTYLVYARSYYRNSSQNLASEQLGIDHHSDLSDAF